MRGRSKYGLPRAPAGELWLASIGGMISGVHSWCPTSSWMDHDWSRKFIHWRSIEELHDAMCVAFCWWLSDHTALDIHSSWAIGVLLSTLILSNITQSQSVLSSYGVASATMYVNVYRASFASVCLFLLLTDQDHYPVQMQDSFSMSKRGQYVHSLYYKEHLFSCFHRSVWGGLARPTTSNGFLYSVLDLCEAKTHTLTWSLFAESPLKRRKEGASISSIHYCDSHLRCNIADQRYLTMCVQPDHLAVVGRIGSSPYSSCS